MIVRIIGIKEIVVFTQREHGMHAQPAGFMHTKLSLTLTLAYAKLGHSYYKNNFSMYITNELSQLMLSLNVVIRAGSFLRQAVDMHSFCEYYDLCAILFLTNQMSCNSERNHFGGDPISNMQPLA